MDWRGAVKASIGSEYEAGYYPPHYIGSIFFFAVAILVGTILRNVNNALAPSSYKSVIADFISTFQTCACSLENMHVLSHYGYSGLALALFIQTYIGIVTYGDSEDSPTGNFQKLYERSLPLNNAGLRISLQAVAAYVSYKFALFVWAVDMLPEHKGKCEHSECMSDLNVSPLTGFSIEAGATIINTWMCMQVLSKSVRVDASIKAAVATFMIVIGLHFTGMYFNPAMASANTFGCKGTDVTEHVLVYWVGPFVGCVVASHLHKLYNLNKLEQGKKAN